MNASGLKETGSVYPQIQESEGGNFWDDGRTGSVRNLKYSSIPSEDNIEFGNLKLHNNAKFSDNLSASFPSANGFYLSDRAAELFQTLGLGSHKFFPANVCKGKIMKQYYWLHLTNDFNNYIDFDKSEFVLNSFDRQVGDGFKLESPEHFHSKLDQLLEEMHTKNGPYLTIRFTHLVLTKTFPNVDFFGFYRMGAQLFTTQSAMDQIINSNLSGFEFRICNLTLFRTVTKYKLSFNIS